MVDSEKTDRILALSAQVNRAHEAGDKSAEETLLRQIVALAPGWVLARNRLGGLLLLQDKYDETQEHLKVSIDLQPESRDGYFLLGVARLRSADPQSAIPALIQSCLLTPDHMQSYIHLALSSAQSNDTARAVNAVRWVMLPVASNQKMRRDLLLSLINQVLGDAVVWSARCRLIRDPGDGLIAELAGEAAMAQGHDRLAVRCLTISSLTCPADANVRINLATALFRIRSMHAAERECRAAIALGADDAGSRFMLARILLASGDSNGASVELDRAVEFDARYTVHRKIIELAVQPSDFLPSWKRSSDSVSTD